MARLTITCAGFLMFLLLPAMSQARPAYKQALSQYFGPLLAKKLNDCRTCHLPDAPPLVKGEDKTDDDQEKPHNAFGARLKSAKGELRKAGKKTAIDDRLSAILDEDSDGDGVSNLLELLAGHFPGEKVDRPTEAELVKAKTTVGLFQKSRAGYPWRPFETVRRPAVPHVKDSSWVRNSVDAFIAAEHESRRLKARPEAPPHVLLRRLYVDLTGLPPTAEELDAFLADKSADAYEKVVDRLLASPRYGERWGRHWMDVWRYSDWAGWGKQVRDSQPHIWRWRDWIIQSLNEDKGYDRMVLEMLAGDELAPEDPKALAATGFLVRNFKLLSREKWLQDTVEHTSAAFLGVTLACARCHDHMFDPIPQKDYYRVRAIFEPHKVRTDNLPGQPDAKKDGLVRAYDADLKAFTYLFIRGDDRTPDNSNPITPGVPEALGGEFPTKIEPVKLPKVKTFPTESTGRRLAFARWLTQRDNPLTARVAVNHIWLRHFGQAIVPSVFDFGRNGRLPSHPALLDWLAAELMDNGWSMKKIHRLIVTSGAYRLSSTADADNLAIDRDNTYLWRMAPRQVEAEVVRDAVFYVAGKLDLTMGGPDIDYPLGLKVPRRSVYFRTAAEKQMEFLQIFDGPSVTECYERKHSIAPQQALALVNSELTIKNARILARSLSAKHDHDAAFVTSAFTQVLTRPPSATELEECASFLGKQTERFRSLGKTGDVSDADGQLPSPNPMMRARENLVHVLMNHHEFVTIR